MTWCEAQGVHFLLGLANNNRLIKRIGDALHSAECAYHLSGQASRVFEDFSYRTVKSWSRARRVVAKAEHLSKGANPRFVVTSLPAERYGARTLYEDLYCARGTMENRSKEQQLDLFADRTSTHTLRANQIRLYFVPPSPMSCSAPCAASPSPTPNRPCAQCGTLRLKLLKIGAQIRISVRRVVVAFSEAFPGAALPRRRCPATPTGGFACPVSTAPCV